MGQSSAAPNGPVCLMNTHSEEHAKQQFLVIYRSGFPAVQFLQVKIQNQLNFTAFSNLPILIPSRMFWVFLHCTGLELSICSWTTHSQGRNSHHSVLRMKALWIFLSTQAYSCTAQSFSRKRIWATLSYQTLMTTDFLNENWECIFSEKANYTTHSVGKAKKYIWNLWC